MVDPKNVSLRKRLQQNLIERLRRSQVAAKRFFDDHAGAVGAICFRELLDNRPSNWRTYRYSVDIFQEVSAKSKEDAEADFEDAVDAVMDRLNAQWQIKTSGNAVSVDSSVINSSLVIQTEPPLGPAVFLQLIVELKTLVYEALTR